MPEVLQLDVTALLSALEPHLTLVETRADRVRVEVATPRTCLQMRLERSLREGQAMAPVLGQLLLHAALWLNAQPELTRKVETDAQLPVAALERALQDVINAIGGPEEARALYGEVVSGAIASAQEALDRWSSSS